MKEAHHPTQLPHKPTPSPYEHSFFHAQYIARSEHYALAGQFEISWLFLFGLLALGLGTAYWSFAAWETYFSFDPYLAEQRDLVTFANAITAIAITLPALLMQQLLLRPQTPWVERHQRLYSILLLVWWFTVWVGMGLPLGSWSGTVSMTSVAALLLLMDRRLDILMGKKAPWIGFSALVLGALLSYQMIGALLWYAAPWLSLVLAFLAMRTWPFKDDPRGIFAASLLFAFSFGPWMTGASRYTGFLSLARYKNLHPQAGALALKKLQHEQKQLHSLRFFSLLYAFTKHDALRPQTTKLLLDHWKHSAKTRRFPAAFLRWRCKPLDLPTFLATLKDPKDQRRLLADLFAIQAPHKEDATWLLQRLEKAWPQHKKMLQTRLNLFHAKKRRLPPQWKQRKVAITTTRPTSLRKKAMPASLPLKKVLATSKPSSLPLKPTSSITKVTATSHPTARPVSHSPSSILPTSRPSSTPTTQTTSRPK